MSDSTKTQSVCKHCGQLEIAHFGIPRYCYPYKHPDWKEDLVFTFAPVSGNAPKVEEIALKLHLYHCQERRSGAICPCHAVVEGMTEGCNCKEETADIVTILRPYFPKERK